MSADKDSVEDCVKKIMRLHENKPKALVIGRWQPLRKGYKWLIDEIKKDGYDILLGIRHTPIDENNPFSCQERIDQIKKEFGETVDYLVLPDIAGIYYGRKVGYKVKEIKPPKKISTISATKTRKKLRN